ncbi:MAG: phosphate ABC transporter ATP-binding protein [Planctomycetes bacterium]|nr:phosphate ABC transporter ATP-binding protein [Planctomycetota bacterium]
MNAECGQIVTAAPVNGPAIEVQNLALAYGRRTVLDGVSLAIERGAITALIGPSGCGKTSFLCALNRLTDMIPGCRVSGSIAFGSLDVRSPAADTIGLRRRMGMIFQKPNPFPLSIRRNIDLPLKEHGVRPRRHRDEIAARALRDVGLWDEVRDRLDAPAQSLSGGQQQRLCIARALALQPEVLLFDEPCGSLDPLATGVVEDLIASFRGRLTVVIVTHDLAQARRMADHAAMFWMPDGVGRLIEHGPARQIFESPQEAVTRAYIAGRRPPV